MSSVYLVMSTLDSHTSLYAACDSASDAENRIARAGSYKKYAGASFVIISMLREHFDAVCQYALQEYCET